MAFHLSATLTVPEADLGATRAALPEHERLTRAEPGCIKFLVSEIHPGVFLASTRLLETKPDLRRTRNARDDTNWAIAVANAVRDFRTWQD